MMCEAARMLLDAYLDNQLSPLQREKVDEHLRECKSCSRIVDESRGYLVCLESYYRWIRPSDALVENALFNLADVEMGKKRTASDLKSATKSDRHDAPSPRSPRRRGVIAAAAVVVLLAAAYGALRLLSGPGAAGEIEAASGPVERRSAAMRDWLEAAAGDALAAGDSVRVGPGGEASIVAERTRLDLKPGAAITLRGESIDGRFEIAVDAGAVAVETVRGENRFVLVTPLAQAHVAESSSNYTAQFAADVRPAETVFTVVRGSFRVVGGGSEVTVPEGRRTVVKAGGAPSAPLPIEATTPPASVRNEPPPRPEATREPPPLVEAARRGDAECLAAVLASPTLGRGDLPGVIRWSEGEKRTDNVRLAALALSAIARSSPDGAPDAVTALSRIARADTSSENRAAAVEALANVPGAASARALRDVALKDADPTVARRAAASLSLRDDADAAAALSVVLKGASDSTVRKEAAKGAIVSEPAAAAEALGPDLPPEVASRATAGASGLAVAIGFARDPAIRFQLLARAETVAGSTDPSDAGLASLAEELAGVLQRDENPLLRRRAALSLGAVPKGTSTAIAAALDAARGDRDESVKVAATLAALRREGQDGGDVQAALLYPRLRSAGRRLEFAAGAAKALPKEAASAVLEKMSEGERSAPLKAAIEAIRRGLGADAQRPGPTPGGDKALGDAAAGLDDPDPEVRARAVASLSGRDEASARDGIFRAIEDADEKVRAAAATALSRLKDDETFDHLHQAFARDPAASVRAAALASISSFSQRDDLADVVGAVLGEEPEEDQRARIAQALARIPGRGATDALVRALAQDGSPAVRSAVVKALGAKKERDAGQALVDALSDADTTFVVEVVSALRQLTGENFAFDPSAEPDEFSAAVAGIHEWWAANAASFP